MNGRHTSLILITGAILFTAAFVEAAPKMDFRRKPVAPEVVTKVLRGRSVVIRLPGVESNGNPIRYEIVSNPSFGKLSSLEQPDPNRQGHGFITYTHGDDELSAVDEFQYRVVTPLSKLTSSPGTVTVHIVDLPPQLGAETSLMFSALVGESSHQVLAMTNIGGGTLHGAVRVRPPFFLDSEGTFALARGKSTNVTLRFTPKETGITPTEKIQPSSDDPNTTISLHGEATAPFVVKAASERLDLQADDARSTTVELMNLSSLPQQITVAANPSEILEEIPPLSLAPKKSQTVHLRIPSKNKGAAENFTVVFSSPTYSQSHNFSAPAVPARLDIVTPELDFTTAREATLTIQNSGGVDGHFSITLPAGITTFEGAATFSVPPGKEKSIRLRLASNKYEAPPTELQITASTGEVERVVLHITPLEIPKPSPAPRPAPTVTQALPPPDISNDNETPVREIVSSQQKPQKTSCTVLIGIPFDPQIDSYRLERLGVTTTSDPTTGLPQQVNFHPIPHDGRIEIVSQYKVPQDDKEISVAVFSIEGLTSGEGTFWRMVPSANGHDLSPTSEFLVTTLPAWRLTWPSMLFWGSLVTLGILTYLRWKSRRLPT